MTLKQLIAVAKIVVEGFVPFIPGAGAAIPIVELAGKIYDNVTADGTQITDEFGNVLSREEVASNIQETFDQALEGLARIKAKGEAELGRTE